MPFITGDKAMFSQLFQNLIENGLKYNKNEKRKISVQFSHLPDGLHFSIIDNGIGISKEYKDQIFEMFKRLHTQETYKGTGIGLAICKKIVSHYGGKIWVESPSGSGSIFCILLPVEVLIQKEVLDVEFA